MDRRWKLRQFIDPLKAEGAQFFLQEPGRLKIIKDGQTQLAYTEQDAKQVLARWRQGASK